MPEYSKNVLNNEYLKLRKQIIDAEFARMNDRQREAVFHTQGPLLILAGAGSGKTTVLVNRIACILKYGNAYNSAEIPAEPDDETIAYLKSCIESSQFEEERLSSLLAVRRVPAWSIMAITFTNKAAGELKERLSGMLGPKAAEIWACTFHSACSRILRRDIDKLGLGYTGSFTIYDTDDCAKVIRPFFKDENADRSFVTKVALPAISRAKEKCMDPKAFEQSVASDFRMKPVAEAYYKYQRALQNANALDFDDMLMLTVRLFEERPDVLEYYQKRFKYILVDEYQDTNPVQYKLVSLLAQAHQNLCVVGDDDQSIYRFRGATIENILSFEKQFKNAKVVKLEQNYRSTMNILNAANEVIANNEERKGKTLWTQNGDGDKIEVRNFDDESSESQYIADTILENVKNGDKFSDHAVLYRMNAQSGSIEKAMVRRGIPYRVIGGFRFYERMEIKDILAYLCVINNKNDNLHFERIVNTPRRGIGNTTLILVRESAEESGMSIYDIFLNAALPCFGKKNQKLEALMDFFEEIRCNKDKIAVHELIERVIRESGYLSALEQDKSNESEDRIQNLNTLISNAVDYEKNQDEPTLEGFLEETALMTDLDNYDTGADTVVLMTVHSAKGLEFPNVFIAGMEEGIFPMQTASLFPDELQEERRLAYVAITRAKQNLCISYARSRMIFGKTVYNRCSRFIEEIPDTYKQQQERPRIVQRKTEPFKRPQPQPGGIGIGAPQISRASNAFCAGDMVKHSTFGEGMVISAKAMGNDTLIEIAFEKYGTKKLMANYAKLTKN